MARQNMTETRDGRREGQTTSSGKVCFPPPHPPCPSPRTPGLLPCVLSPLQLSDTDLPQVGSRNLSPSITPRLKVGRLSAVSLTGRRHRHVFWWNVAHAITVKSWCYWREGEEGQGVYNNTDFISLNTFSSHARHYHDFK